MTGVHRVWQDVGWLPAPIRIDVWPHPHAPTRPVGPCTAAFAVAHHLDGRLLLVEHQRRGPDLPGGHREPEESPAETAARELAEETGVRITAERLSPAGIIGCWVQAPRPPGYTYPHPYSHMVVFAVTLTARDVAHATDVIADIERAGRRWATPAEVGRLCAGAPWLVLAGAPSPM